MSDLQKKEAEKAKQNNKKDKKNKSKRRKVDDEDDEEADDEGDEDDEDDDAGAAAALERWGIAGINRPCARPNKYYSLCPIHIAIKRRHLVRIVYPR